MISLSCMDIVGRIISDGGDRERQDTGGNGRSFQAKKYRYGLDIEGFWLGDNCRIIADIAHPF